MKYLTCNDSIRRGDILKSYPKIIKEETKKKGSGNTEVFLVLLLRLSHSSQNIKYCKIILELIYNIIPKISTSTLNSKIGYFFNFGVKAIKNSELTSLIVKTLGIWLSRVNFCILDSLMKRSLIILLLTLSSCGTKENRNSAKLTFQQIMHSMNVFHRDLSIQIIKFTQQVSVDRFQLINLIDCLKPCIHIFSSSCNEVLLKIFFNGCSKNNDETLKYQVFHLIAILLKIWSKDTLTKTKLDLLKKIFNELRFLNPKNNDKLLKPIYLKVLGKCLLCLYLTQKQFIWIKFLYFCTLLTKCCVSKCYIINLTGLKVWRQLMKVFLNNRASNSYFKKNNIKTQRQIVLSKVVMILRSNLTFEQKHGWSFLFLYISSFCSSLSMKDFSSIIPLLKDLLTIREMKNKLKNFHLLYINLDKMFGIILRSFGPQNVCKIISLRLPKSKEKLTEQELITRPRHWLIHLLKNNCRRATLTNFIKLIAPSTELYINLVKQTRSELIKIEAKRIVEKLWACFSSFCFNFFNSKSVEKKISF